MNDELIELRDLIEERTGLFFRDGWGVEVLQDKLNARLAETKCASFMEYRERLDGGAGGEWPELIAALTRNKSTFFRQAAAVAALTETIIPRWVAENPGRPLRIWSAACSDGPEPVSIAMTLRESGWANRLEIEIDATDANPEVLRKAKQGIFGEKKLAGVSPELRGRYFQAVDGGWLAAPDIRSQIRWSAANLMNENEIAAFATADIIFCRNVFIYFLDRKISQTLHLFAKYMPPGGYLISDDGDHFHALVAQTGAFEPAEVTGVSAWRKCRVPPTPVSGL